MRACRRVAGTAPLVGCALISEARVLLGILRAQLRLSALRSHLHELTLTGMRYHHSLMCDADAQAGSCSSASCCCCARKLLLPLLLRGDALSCHPIQLCT